MVSITSAVPAGVVIALEEVFGIIKPAAAQIETIIGVVRPDIPPIECLSAMNLFFKCNLLPVSKIALIK